MNPNTPAVPNAPLAVEPTVDVDRPPASPAELCQAGLRTLSTPPTPQRGSHRWSASVLICLLQLGCGLPPPPGNPGEPCEQSSECLGPARCFEGRCYHVGPANCDPATTEGTACHTGLEGPCATGHLRCTSDTEATCIAEAAEPYDLCNDGIDNDCDGKIDEDPPGESGRCATIKSCSPHPQPEARTSTTLPLRYACVGSTCEATPCDCGPTGRNDPNYCEDTKPIQCGPPDRWRRFHCDNEPGVYIRSSRCPLTRGGDPRDYAGPWLDWAFSVERPGAYALRMRQIGGACGQIFRPSPEPLKFALVRPSGALEVLSTNQLAPRNLRQPVTLVDCLALDAGAHHVYVFAYHPEGCPCGRTDCETAPLYNVYWLELSLL